MKSIYSVAMGLAILLVATLFASPAHAYVSRTRATALTTCESAIAWYRQNAPLGWVYHGHCVDGSYTQPYADYLGCYILWGAYDIPSENSYNPDTPGVGDCYGLDTDPPGANGGAGGGCDGGEGGCPLGAQNAGAPTAGDPVNTATGNKYVEEDDYTDSVWLRLRRFYNSDPVTSSSTMGMRWGHSFSRKLSRVNFQNGTSDVTVYRPNGVREYFHKTGSGHWTAIPDNPDGLTESIDAQGNTAGYTVWIAALRQTETYTADGLLRGIQDARGQTETLTYSDSSTDRAVAARPNLLLTVMAPDGRQLRFTYDSTDDVRQITLPDGGVLAYDYDGYGNLVAVTYPDGKKRQYVYNESTLTGGSTLPYVMTGLIDENGSRFETTSYDANGRATATESAGGAGRVAIQYNADGSSDVTYPLGSTSHQGYTAVQQLFRIANLDKPCGECKQPYASRTYDANARPATYTDFNGHVRATTYDANGLLIQDIDAQGTADQRTVATTWNATLRVPLTRTTTDANGKLISQQSWAYNATGLTTASCTIDPAAAPSYTCAATGTPPAGVRRTVNTYCGAVDTTTCPLAGLLLSTDGPRSDVADTVNYAYYLTTDESGCATVGGSCHHLGDLRSVTDGDGHVTTYISYDKAGRVTRVRDPHGVLTDYTYTPRGWLATTTVRGSMSGSASASDATTTVAYDPTGTVHAVTDPDGVTTTYTYDAAHRLTDITDALGRRTHDVLDAAGHRTRTQVLAADGSVVRARAKAFNALGQLTAITDGLGRNVFTARAADSYDGNGNLVHSQDGLGVQHKQVFDALNRLVSTLRDYQGTNTATANTSSVTHYDALDRVTGFSDPDGLSTAYDLDGLGNLTALHSPDTGSTTRTYDAAGNPTGSTDAIHTSTTSTYDALNRLTGTTYADPSLNVSYRYDEADAVTGCTGSFAQGRLTRVMEANGGISYCYDAQGNVTRKQQTVGTVTTTTRYAWTPGRRLATLTTPHGTVVTYTRDANGRVSGMTATPSGGSATTVVSNVTYQPFGPVASYRLGNGQTVTRTYDANGQLTDVASPAFNLHTSRDVMGNVTAVGNASGVATPSETYTYDPLYRLTGVNDVSGTVIEAYTYRPTGDRLTKTGAGLLTGPYRYAAGTHHLVGVGTTARVVDARGNTTADVLASGIWGYGYNARNRLSVVQKDKATVGTYVLNALGQRVQKTASGQVTRFDYDEASHLLSESAGSVTRDYLWLDDLPVGVVDDNGNGSGTIVSYVYADGLGTPRVVTDATGAVLWSWAYASNPFGERAPISTGGYVFNLRFPGQYFDAESGLIYNLNRDYEPATGRYIESDPIGLNGGANTYAYVSGTPHSSTDASGLVEHVTGRWIDCGGGCRIRIDYTLDPKTNQKVRHLHWECKGGEGECGENGRPSHGGSWEDAPRRIRDCALRNGFNGAAAEEPEQHFNGPEPSKWLYPIILVGGAAYILLNAITP